MRKLADAVIYSDDRYYAAFPSIVCRSDGELLLAFRRAPNRRLCFAPHDSHCDPNSYLVLTRSADGGQTWSHQRAAPLAMGPGHGGSGETGEPELIYAHPLGGSQDPCLVEIDDGSLLVSSYAWMLLPRQGVPYASEVYRHEVYGWPFTFLGGYLMRSVDGGRSWHGPIVPPQVPEEMTYFPGVPIPAMNRGAMTQGRDGVLYWAVARSPADNPTQTALDLLTSRDRGLTWEHAGRIAADEKVAFNETSLIETPAGDLVAFIRTANFGDHGVVARSRNHGRSWTWQDLGVVGHPYHATRLRDGRVFLVYGYRHEPYGIRARLFDPECSRLDVPELVLRADGGNGDLGYPWACTLPDGNVLAVYYFNRADGTRHIAGTWVEV